MKCILYICLLVSSLQAFSQINCEALFEKGTPCYNACMVLSSETSVVNIAPQGCLASIGCLDSAIANCPTFGPLYYVKAIPYLKRGEFIMWKKLIDKAVEFDPLFYHGYRGGARFMFLRDYEGAIRDIEEIKRINNGESGTIYNGEYHLEVIRALSYRGIGDTLKAANILQEHIQSYELRGYHDYYHLGVLLYQLKRFDEAEQALIKQLAYMDYYADTYYYLALINKEKNNMSAYHVNLEKAQTFYKEGKCLRGLNSFMDYPDKVYLKEIETRLNEILP